MSPIWMSASNFYSTDDIDINTKSNTAQSFDAIEDDASNSNFSKMRSYLKRCENAINRINLSGKRVASSLSTSSSSKESYGPRTRKSTSSWYIDELRSECNDIQNEINHCNEIETNAADEQTINFIPENQTNKVNNEHENDRIQKYKCMPALQMVSLNYNHNHMYRKKEPELCINVQ